MANKKEKCILCELKDRLEQLVRVSFASYSDVKVQKNNNYDRFAVFLEKKEKFNLENIIKKTEDKLEEIESVVNRKTCFFHIYTVHL